MNKAELGQVFTSSIIADYMVSLLDLDKDSAILDPCFGGGAFIASLKKASFCNITGCELDTTWYENAQQQFENVELIHGDFLQFTPLKLFDGVIMNPPYIRQERIDDLLEYGITKDVLNSNPIFDVLPRSANFYMYFVLKAIALLKNEGQLIVIFPSSWMDARVGENFKNYLYRECDVLEQIHVHGEIFENDALVDVVILKIAKRKSTNSTKIISLVASSGNIEEVSAQKQTLTVGFKMPFSKYGIVRRGLTTGFNEAFVNPTTGPGFDEYLVPILSSPKNLVGYSTQNAKYDNLLLIPQNATLSSALQAYLHEHERVIIETQKPKTLYEKILRGDRWYHLTPFSGKGLIFSYFVRNDMKFIMHQNDAIIRDNFYIITPCVDLYLMTALLNNYYTFYQLELSGKKYGAGLLKIQRYDIENLLFPDISLFEESEIDLMCEYAKQLIDTGNEQFISKITGVLEKASTVSASSITNDYLSTKRIRLEKC